MTFVASRLTVLAITAPQPSLKPRLITLRFVPGGPEPMTKGLGSFRPSTVVASVGMGKESKSRAHAHVSLGKVLAGKVDGSAPISKVQCDARHAPRRRDFETPAETACLRTGYGAFCGHPRPSLFCWALDEHASEFAAFDF